MYYFIVYTDGEMTAAEMEECKKGNWIPLLTYQVGDFKSIPVFKLKDVAWRFAKRNIPDCVRAICNLTDDAIVKLSSEGFQFYHYDYPQKIHYKPKVHIIESSVEIHRVRVIS